MARAYARRLTRRSRRASGLGIAGAAGGAASGACACNAGGSACGGRSDERIGQLAANPDDELEAKRLKKRKLQLKDCIARLESLLIPDEPA